jgi:hypothetical protein
MKTILDLVKQVYKASSIGRSMAIILPILLVIGFLIIVISVIRGIVRRIKNKKLSKLQ